MTVVAILRTRNGIPTNAEGCLLQITDNAGKVVIPPPNTDGTPSYPSTVPVDPETPGYYSYETNLLGPGIYTAIWSFANAGYADDVVTRVFTLDEPIAVPDGITLMRLERLIARRVGPYREIKATAGSSLHQLAATAIQSSLLLGSYEDQYLLRRGMTAQGALIPTYTSDDRTRAVERYDNDNGYLIPDRLWSVAPDASVGEIVEVMYLEPDVELRPAVIDGLRRCFFWDTVALTGTDALGGAVNVTAVAPWITSNHQIREVGFGQLSSRTLPVRASSWRAFQQGGRIYLGIRGGLPGAISLSVLRPVYSLVNDETSLTGPNDDQDIVRVDPDYAAWAGIVELWKTVPERLAPLTHESLRLDLKTCAQELTKKSLVIANQIPDRIQLDWGNSFPGLIGNAPEARV